MDQADSGNHAGAGRVAVVHAVGGQRGDLQERAAVVEQPVDPLTREQFAPGDVPFAGLFRPAQRGGGEAVFQLPGQAELCLAVRGIAGAAGVHLAGDCLH